MTFLTAIDRYILRLTLVPMIAVFGIGWGTGLGMTWSQSWALYALLIPGGQEAEYMGYLGFFGRVLTWLPAVVYAYVNEASGGQMANVMANVPTMLLGLAVLTFGVDVQQGQADVKQTLARRNYCQLAAPGADTKVSPAE